MELCRRKGGAESNHGKPKKCRAGGQKNLGRLMWDPGLVGITTIRRLPHTKRHTPNWPWKPGVLLGLIFREGDVGGGSKGRRDSAWSKVESVKRAGVRRENNGGEGKQERGRICVDSRSCGRRRGGKDGVSGAARDNRWKGRTIWKESVDSPEVRWSPDI